MRRREFIAGAAATTAMGFAQPICAQTDASAARRKTHCHFRVGSKTRANGKQ